MRSALKIISGGQTGVDRAALDSALGAGFQIGGYVPKGRLAEDKPLPKRYSVVETNSIDYAVRTKLNILDSDATIILNQGLLQGGTKLTWLFCRQMKKPILLINLDEASDGESEEEILSFLEHYQPQVLNVAGPRESKCPGIYEQARRVLNEVFVKWEK